MSYPVSIDEFCQVNGLSSVHSAILQAEVLAEGKHLQAVTKTSEEWKVYLKEILNKPA